MSMKKTLHACCLRGLMWQQQLCLGCLVYLVKPNAQNTFEWSKCKWRTHKFKSLQCSMALFLLSFWFTRLIFPDYQIDHFHAKIAGYGACVQYLPLLTYLPTYLRSSEYFPYVHHSLEYHHHRNNSCRSLSWTRTFKCDSLTTNLPR